jgi:hypothetical protein
LRSASEAKAVRVHPINAQRGHRGRVALILNFVTITSAPMAFPTRIKHTRYSQIKDWVGPIARTLSSHAKFLDLQETKQAIPRSSNMWSYHYTRSMYLRLTNKSPSTTRMYVITDNVTKCST